MNVPISSRSPVVPSWDCTASIARKARTSVDWNQPSTDGPTRDSKWAGSRVEVTGGGGEMVVLIVTPILTAGS